MKDTNLASWTKDLQEGLDAEAIADNFIRQLLSRTTMRESKEVFGRYDEFILPEIEKLPDEYKVDRSIYWLWDDSKVEYKLDRFDTNNIAIETVSVAINGEVKELGWGYTSESDALLIYKEKWNMFLILPTQALRANIDKWWSRSTYPHGRNITTKEDGTTWESQFFTVKAFKDRYQLDPEFLEDVQGVMHSVYPTNLDPLSNHHISRHPLIHAGLYHPSGDLQSKEG